MALIDRFTALFRRGEPEQTKTTSDELPKPSRPAAVLKRFKVENTRRARVLDCRKMYDEDSRAEGVLAALARDVARGGVRVEVSEGTDVSRAQMVADELLSRLNVVSRIDDWVRLTLRDGDSFLELSVDGQGRIVQLTRKPTLEMRRNSDAMDRFPDPARAFWWADTMWAGQAPQDAVWFAAWQIIHARWHHDEGERYGRPLFTSARKSWKRMDEGEFDIAVRRKTRAGMKFLHVVEGASEPDIERYKERNRDVLDNPFAAVADYFTNKPGSLQTIQGDARLSEIADVTHHIRTWWIASPVPMSLLGYGQDLNRDVLEKQKEQYDEALEPIKTWVGQQFVKPLLERQWLLTGIWPGGLGYELKWPTTQVVTPEELKMLAEALVRLRATMLFPDEILLQIAASILPGIDPQAILAMLQAERPDEVGRMATAAASLGV
jgi:hypothetical protein